MSIYEIAKKTGVSPTTVSRVINGGEHVSEKTKEKVEQAIRQAGYTPSFFARALNMKETKLVGILCPVISDINHARLVALLEKRLREQDFDIIVCSIEENYNSKAKYLDLLIQKHVEAVFVIGMFPDDHEGAEAMLDASETMPVIIIGGLLHAENIYNVFCQEKEMAISLVNMLCLAGHSHIMYIYDSETFSGLQKKSGFEEGMRSCGLDPTELILQIPEGISMTNIPASTETIYKFISESTVKPDAIMTAGDIMATPAQKAIHQLGMDIPVIGWNNGMYSQIATPSLTSVDTNMELMSETGIRILMNVLEGKNTPRYNPVPAKLVQRESCIITQH